MCHKVSAKNETLFCFLCAIKEVEFEKLESGNLGY